MMCLYQYCDHCKTERNFDPETLKCKTCKNTNNGSKNSNTRKPTQHKS